MTGRKTLTKPDTPCLSVTPFLTPQAKLRQLVDSGPVRVVLVGPLPCAHTQFALVDVLLLDCLLPEPLVRLCSQEHAYLVSRLHACNVSQVKRPAGAPVAPIQASSMVSKSATPSAASAAAARSMGSSIELEKSTDCSLCSSRGTMPWARAKARHLATVSGEV